MVTDKLRSYGAAYRVAMLSVEHRSSKDLNNPRTPDTQQRDSAHRRAGHRPQLNIDATNRLLAGTKNKVSSTGKEGQPGRRRAQAHPRETPRNPLDAYLQDERIPGPRNL
jgi:hypothetical protein